MTRIDGGILPSLTSLSCLCGRVSENARQFALANPVPVNGARYIIQGISVDSFGGIWTTISLSNGSPNPFSRLLDENENLSIFPLIGSKECAGMVGGWASRKCAWRYSNGSLWRLNDANKFQWKSRGRN